MFYECSICEAFNLAAGEEALGIEFWSAVSQVYIVKLGLHFRIECVPCGELQETVAFIRQSLRGYQSGLGWVIHLIYILLLQDMPFWSSLEVEVENWEPPHFLRLTLFSFIVTKPSLLKADIKWFLTCDLWKSASWHSEGYLVGKWLRHERLLF